VCTACPAELARDLDGAFPLFVGHHRDLVYGIALRRVRDPRDAEDLSQDTFVAAYRALRDYRLGRIAELRPRAWLAAICLNLIRNHARRRGARPRSDPLDAALERPDADAASPEAVALQREERRRWAVLLAEVPARYRTAVELRHVDGLSYPELAVALGRPVNTVKSDVHRGVRALRDAYERSQGSRETEVAR
jgi:RNA polymerase sigma factor (sigma-70 family)